MRDAAGMRRRWTPGETRDGEIKTAPEKMHRAAFPAEARAEILKHAIGLHKNTPKAIRIIAIIRAVRFVALKGNGILDFVRRRVNGHRQLQFSQRVHHRAVKIRNRAWPQSDRASPASAAVAAQLVIDKIETDLEC